MISTILTSQTFYAEKLFSFRGFIKINELNILLKELVSKITECGAIPIGNPIIAEFSKQEDLHDIEVLIPINKEIECTTNTTNIVYKNNLKINNAVMLSYKGSHEGLKTAYNDLNTYMATNKLTPSTAYYSVVTVLSSPNDIIETNIYVGVDA